MRALEAEIISAPNAPSRDADALASRAYTENPFALPPENSRKSGGSFARFAVYRK
jgi:hypothetical protein